MSGVGFSLGLVVVESDDDVGEQDHVGHHGCCGAGVGRVAFLGDASVWIDVFFRVTLREGFEEEEVGGVERGCLVYHIPPKRALTVRK